MKRKQKEEQIHPTPSKKMKPNMRCNIILPFLATNSLSKLNFTLSKVSPLFQQVVQSLPPSLHLHFVSTDKDEIDHYNSLEIPKNVHLNSINNWSDIWRKNLVQDNNATNYIGLECNWRFKFNYLNKMDSEFAPQWTNIEDKLKQKYEKGTFGNAYRL